MYISNIKYTVGSAITTFSQKVVEAITEKDNRIRKFALIIFCCLAAMFLYSRCCKKNVKKIDPKEEGNDPKPVSELKTPTKPKRDGETQNVPENPPENKKPVEEEVADHPQQDNAKALLELRNALRSEGKYQEAAKKFKELVSTDLLNPTKIIPYGEALLEIGDYSEALIQFSRAITVDPKDDFLFAMANRGSARALVGLGRRSEAVINFIAAETYFEKAMKTKPDDPLILDVYRETLCDYGKMLLEVQNLAIAEIRFKKALDIIPTDLEILKLYGEVVHQTWNSEEVATVFERAITVLPQAPELLKIYKDALFKYARAGNWTLDDYVKMMTHFKKARTVFSDDKAFLDVGNKVLQEYHTILQRYLGDYFSRNMFEPAAKLCEEALEITPRSPWILGYSASILRKQGKIEEAAQRYEQVLAITKKGETLVRYASVLSALNRVDDARAQLNEALLLTADPAFKLRIQTFLNMLDIEGKFEF